MNKIDPLPTTRSLALEQTCTRVSDDEWNSAAAVTNTLLYMVLYSRTWWLLFAVHARHLFILS